MTTIISPRDRKILWNTIITTSLLYTFLGLYFFFPEPTFLHAAMFFAFIVFAQCSTLITPVIFDMYFFKSLHPTDKTKELEHKIVILQEEIKRVNGENYDDEIHFKF